MELRRTTLLGAAFGATAILFATPAAFASAPPTASVSPGTVKPGGTLTVSTTCDTRAEANYGVRGGHQPYDTKTMVAQGKKRTATFQLPSTLKPGKYVAWVFCEGSGNGQDSVQAPLTDFLVVANGAVPPQVTKKPVGAPQTGGGPVDAASSRR